MSMDRFIFSKAMFTPPSATHVCKVFVNILTHAHQDFASKLLHSAVPTLIFEIVFLLYVQNIEHVLNSKPGQTLIKQELGFSCDVWMVFPLI